MISDNIIGPIAKSKHQYGGVVYYAISEELIDLIDSEAYFVFQEIELPSDWISAENRYMWEKPK